MPNLKPQTSKLFELWPKVCFTLAQDNWKPNCSLKWNDKLNQDIMWKDCFEKIQYIKSEMELVKSART